MAINTPFHAHEYVVCANIFVRKNGKYLLIRRSPQKRFAPNVVHPIGGKVDPGENPYSTAQRELLEEAGIRAKNIRLEAVLLENIGKIKNHKAVGPDWWMIFHFSGDWASGKLKKCDEGELVLLAPEEIKTQNLIPSVRATIDRILNPKDGTVFASFTYDSNGNVIAKHTRIDVCKVQKNSYEEPR